MARIPLAGARFEYDTATSELIITIPEAPVPDHQDPVNFVPGLEMVLAIRVTKPVAQKPGRPDLVIPDPAAEHAKQPRGGRGQASIRLNPSQPPAAPTVTEPVEVAPGVEPAPAEVDPVDAADLPPAQDQSTEPTLPAIPDVLDPDEVPEGRVPVPVVEDIKEAPGNSENAPGRDKKP